MKEIKLFQCSFCKTNYSNEQQCKECEDNHKAPSRSKIICEKYYSKGIDHTGYPAVISVIMDDGVSVKFKRSKR